MNPGSLQFSLEDFQNATRTYRRDLLRLPMIALAPSLQYMTMRPGIRHEEMVGQTSLDIELQPYVRNARQNADLDLDFRALRTYFGTVNADFEPNAAISTILGHRASQASGDALQTTIQAHEVLALVPKVIGEKLAMHLFDAVRDPKGKTTKTLFNGFDTITATEIAAGNISAEKKNLIEINQAPDKKNAVDIAQAILYSLSDVLRGETAYLYCSQSFVDLYNQAYKATTGLVPYNTQYEKVSVEGSNGKLIFAPLPGKAGSNFLHVSTRQNLLVGCDQMSDTEKINVACFEPDTFTLMMRMFFGVQFESIDPRRIMVAKLPEADAAKEDDEIDEA